MNKPGTEQFTVLTGDLWEYLSFSLLHLTCSWLLVSWNPLIFVLADFMFIPLAFITNASYTKYLHQYRFLISIIRRGTACYYCFSSTLSYQQSSQKWCVLALLDDSFLLTGLASIVRNQWTQTLAKLQTVGPFYRLIHKETVAWLLPKQSKVVCILNTFLTCLLVCLIMPGHIKLLNKRNAVCTVTL